MKLNVKLTGLLMTAMLAVSVPVLYADTGNGGNLTGGSSSVPVTAQEAPALATNQAVSSQEGQRWHHKHDHSMEGRLFHKLRLTDDQQKQLTAIKDKQHETMKATMEQMKTIKESLNKELLLPTVDMNKINALSGQLKTIQAQIMDNHLNSMLEIKKILTPEQFEKYLKLMKHQMKERRHKHGSYCKGKQCKVCGHKGWSDDEDRE